MGRKNRGLEDNLGPDPRAGEASNLEVLKVSKNLAAGRKPDDIRGLQEAKAELGIK